MAPALTIDPATGAILLEGLARLEAGSEKSGVADALAPLLTGHRDFGNGYAWFYFDGLSFGGKPCSLGLCWSEGRLVMAMWGVDLADPPGSAGDWPTPEECEAEVSFVLAELRRQLGRPFRTGEERFPWGAAYSAYDPKGGSAASGLRYE